MTATLALNVSTGAWLKYAVMSIGSHLDTALPITIGVSAVLFVVFGWLWGRIWNNSWSPLASPTRWGGVALAAIFSALCFASVDSLYGNSFFNSEPARNIKAWSGEPLEVKASEDVKDEMEHAKPVIDGLLKMNHITNESDAGLTLDSQFVSAYSNSMMLLWVLACAGMLALLAGVALASISNITVVTPYVEKK